MLFSAKGGGTAKRAMRGRNALSTRRLVYTDESSSAAVVLFLARLKVLFLSEVL